MSVWVLVPVKPLSRAKSRLAEALTPAERANLAEIMLRRTLSVVKSVPQIAGVLVISRDSYVLALARDMGAHTVQESGAPELNNALMRATRVLSGWRAGAVLILPADIPLVNAEDIRNIIQLGNRNNSVVIVTDYNQDGTNVLMVRPPGMFSYVYGENSFERHKQLAELAGATVHVYESERLKLDIDTPSDLEIYESYLNQQLYEAKPLLIRDNAE